MAPSVAMSDSMALRTYRFHLRRARIDIDDGILELVIPGFFGSRPWTIPAGEVSVSDLTSWQLNDQAADVLFRNAVHIPYLFTTGPHTRPTTLLLFRTPQQTPPLRHVFMLGNINSDFPYSWRESRSSTGAKLDGVFLRALDPEGAAQRLVDAGVARVNSPTQWLQDHRDLVTDPVEREHFEAHLTRGVRLGRASTVLLYGSLLVAAVMAAQDWLPPAVWVVPVLMFILGFVLRRAASSNTGSLNSA